MIIEAADLVEAAAEEEFVTEPVAAPGGVGVARGEAVVRELVGGEYMAVEAPPWGQGASLPPSIHAA